MMKSSNNNFKSMHYSLCCNLCIFTTAALQSEMDLQPQVNSGEVLGLSEPNYPQQASWDVKYLTGSIILEGRRRAMQKQWKTIEGKPYM